MSPFLIAILVVAGGLTYLALLFWMIAFFSGWSRMARNYVAYHRPVGETYGWRTLRTGPMAGYDNAMTVVLSSEGIYLTPFVAFRVGHPPLLLPWSLVTEVKPARFPRTGLQVTIEPEGKRLTLFLPNEARGTLERFARRGLTSPAPPLSVDELPNLNVGDRPG